MKEKRTPVSIYLTPRASAILREYSVGSGYGSLSRTVEEIIFAFDFACKTVQETTKYFMEAGSQKHFTDTEKLLLFAILEAFWMNLNNALFSRLNKEPPLTP